MRDLTVSAQFCDELRPIDGGRFVVSDAVGEMLTLERIAAQFGASVTISDNPHVGSILAQQRRIH